MLKIRNSYIDSNPDMQLISDRIWSLCLYYGKQMILDALTPSLTAHPEGFLTDWSDIEITRHINNLYSMYNEMEVKTMLACILSDKDSAANSVSFFYKRMTIL